MKKAIDQIAARLPQAALDQLMPMHLWIGPSGLINRVGPTLTRIAGEDLRGRPLFDVIDLQRPRAARKLEALLALQGARLTMNLRTRPDLPFRGVVVGLPAGVGGLIQLSLGLSFSG